MINQELFAFIKNSPTAFQTVESIKTILLEKGFSELKEEEQFELQPQKNYFVCRNNSSIIAFKLPEGFNKPLYHIVATHADSPGFKVKPNANLKTDKYQKVGIEPYGGMIASTWFDRPLSVAGIVYYEVRNRLVSQNVVIDKDLLVIPSVAIHLNRSVNEGQKINMNIDMPPLMAIKEADLERLIYQSLSSKVNVEKILGYNLFLYNRQEGFIFGANDEFIGAPRLDDLQSTYAGLKAFTETNSNNIDVFCCFDNEEIGSKTRQGADSTFLSDTLERIAQACSFDNRQALAKSFLVSADNAHAVHPNHPELSDSTNRVYLNQGIAIKFNAAQSYTTDGMSLAYFKMICEKSDIPYQLYANRPDLRGGGTLGNILASRLNLASIDIGCPQLAMHSACETSGSKDTETMYLALKAFYEEN